MTSNRLRHLLPATYSVYFLTYLSTIIIFIHLSVRSPSISSFLISNTTILFIRSFSMKSLSASLLLPDGLPRWSSSPSSRRCCSSHHHHCQDQHHCSCLYHYYYCYCFLFLYCVYVWPRYCSRETRQALRIWTNMTVTTSTANTITTAGCKCNDINGSCSSRSSGGRA